MPERNILFLYNRDYRCASTIVDHISSFKKYSKSNIYLLNNLGDLPTELDLDRFDALVIHYSLVACHDYYISPSARARIGAFPGLKAAFIQDEYRFVDATIAALRMLGIHVLFTCVPETELDKVYPETKLRGVRSVPVLTGYVPEGLLDQPLPPFAERPVDVGYRGRNVPAWLGALGQEKRQIGERFLRDAKRYGLRCDIAWNEEDRIYGNAWIHFLSNCKATLGVESGASVFDFAGDIERQVEAHLEHNPSVSFETLQTRYFKGREGAIRMNQISPRCFEATCLKTLMILYEGEYSGVLAPWRHYVPLKKDHSNMDEVVAVLRDPARAEAIIGRAYVEVACNPDYSYKACVQLFDAVLDEEWGRTRPASAPAYLDRDFGQLARAHRWALMRRKLPGLFYALVHRLLFRYVFGFLSPRSRDRIRMRLRPVVRRLRTLVHTG